MTYMQKAWEDAIEKYLNGLIIDERVNGHGRSFIVRLICIAAKLRSGNKNNVELNGHARYMTLTSMRLCVQ